MLKGEAKIASALKPEPEKPEPEEWPPKTLIDQIAARVAVALLALSQISFHNKRHFPYP
jgi:hypothetical protein